jgi:hypothetical protein
MAIEKYVIHEKAVQLTQRYFFWKLELIDRYKSKKIPPERKELWVHW